MNEIIEYQSQPGWLLPYLFSLDIAELDLSAMSKKQRREANIQDTAPTIFKGYNRWAYWLWICEHNDLPANPIPRIEFDGHPQPTDAKAVQNWLQIAVRRHYSWYDEAWMWLVKWLLFGFGYTAMGVESEIGRIPDDLKIDWYRQVNLANLLNSPCDWSAFVLQGGLQDDKSTRSPWSKSTGFYSTPLNVCTLMTEMNFSTYDDKFIDPRTLTVCDPCCGTGSMLLPASNYSLRLYGQDIVGDLCLCSILNGYLWMPWLVLMPAEVDAMLTARYEQSLRWLKMRDLLTGAAEPAPLEKPSALPTGVAVTTSPDTVHLAEQRRQSADDFHEAVKSGQLKQMAFTL